RDRKEALLEADLARAVALRTRLRRRARLGAAPAARLAAREAWDGERPLAATARVDERDGEVVLEVGATPGARARSRAASGAEEVAEEIAQDVVEAGGEVEAAGALLERRVPEAIVLGAALRVGEDLVGLADLLEALLGFVARLRVLV